MMILCIGTAPVGAITTDIVMAAAPPERAGAASGISETSFEFGGAFGIAALGSVVTAVYRGTMAAEPLPDIPARALEAAQDTLGAAAEVAAQMGGAQGEHLLRTARHAFVHAFEVASVISALGVVAAALLAVVFLPRAR
jgi:DHA2 family multidrug resistance protein-like MFS transporter